jgi:hypothetical protein
MTKKITTIILAVILITAMLPTVAFASNEFFNPDDFATHAELLEAVMVEYHRHNGTGAEYAAIYASYERARDVIIARENAEMLAQIEAANQPPATGINTASDWAIDAITEMDFIQPFSDYRTDITRGEFIDMVIRWIEVETGTDIWSTIGVPMWITDDELEHSYGTIWHYPINRENKLDAAIRIGFTDGQNLEGTLTREQAATMVMRAFNMVNHINYTRETTGSVIFSFGFSSLRDGTSTIWGADGNPIFVPNTETTAIINAPIAAPTATFNDMAEVNSWAIGGVNFVAANGIMQGSGGNFSPRQNLTVEMAIVLINNIDMENIEIEDESDEWIR